MTLLSHRIDSSTRANLIMTSSILRRLLLVLLLSLTSVSLAPPSLAVAGDRERKVADDDEDKANVHLIPVEDDDPTYGNREEALVTLVVFSDFECPFCQKGAKVMKELQTHYGKKDVRMVFKHLPLPFHKQAKPAARAAIAAHNQGQFWDMHDQLFYDREALKAGGSEYFISLANKIELDVKTFEKDFASKDTESKLEKDMELAKEVGARGTPNFFINGIQVVGARPADDFKSVIDDQFKSMS